MKLGMNLLLWSDDVRGDKLAPVLERIKAMGFDGVEVPIFDPDAKAYEILGRRLDDLGLARTALTIRRAEHNPISPDAAVRRAGLEHLEGILESCAALRAPLLVGPNYAALGVFSGKGPTVDEWRRGVESARAAAEAAAPYDVTFALEALNRFELYLVNTAADMARFVREVAHPRCRMMHDTFHAHIEEKDVTAAVLATAESLVHIHVSENDRSTPGKGQVAWGETFAALRRIGYDGWLTIEAFGQALPALAAATHIWRPLFESEEQVASEGLAFMKRAWAESANGADPRPRGPSRAAAPSPRS